MKRTLLPIALILAFGVCVFFILSYYIIDFNNPFMIVFSPISWLCFSYYIPSDIIFISKPFVMVLCFIATNVIISIMARLIFPQFDARHKS